MDKKRLDISVRLGETDRTSRTLSRGIAASVNSTLYLRRGCRLGPILWKRDHVPECFEIGETLYWVRR